MARLRIHGFTISLDGYGAGPKQSEENPLGVGGEQLHDWMVHTSSFKRMHGGEGGDAGIDDDFTARGSTGIGGGVATLRQYLRLRRALVGGPRPSGTRLPMQGVRPEREGGALRHLQNIA
jgi:hypothetical protein